MVLKKKSQKQPPLTDEQIDKLGPKIMQGLGLDPQKVDKLAQLLAAADIPKTEKEMWADLVFQMTPEEIDKLIANLEKTNKITQRQDEQMQKDLDKVASEAEKKIDGVIKERDKKIDDFVNKKINDLKK